MTLINLKIRFLSLKDIIFTLPIFLFESTLSIVMTVVLYFFSKKPINFFALITSPENLPEKGFLGDIKSIFFHFTFSFL